MGLGCLEPSLRQQWLDRSQAQPRGIRVATDGGQSLWSDRGAPLFRACPMMLGADP